MLRAVGSSLMAMKRSSYPKSSRKLADDDVPLADRRRS